MSETSPPFAIGQRVRSRRYPGNGEYIVSAFKRNGKVILRFNSSRDSLTVMDPEELEPSESSTTSNSA